MEVARQRVQVRTAAAQKKEEKAKGKEGASSSAPKAVDKGVPKRKANGKDNRPSKKVPTTPGEAVTSQAQTRVRQRTDDDVWPYHPGTRPSSSYT